MLGLEGRVGFRTIGAKAIDRESCRAQRLI